MTVPRATPLASPLCHPHARATVRSHRIPQVVAKFSFTSAYLQTQGSPQGQDRAPWEGQSFRGRQALAEGLGRLIDCRANGQKEVLVTIKARRVVIESGLVPKAGRPLLWAYGYADLAALLGTTEEGVRSRVKRGSLDPSSLESIAQAWAGRRQP